MTRLEKRTWYSTDNRLPPVGKQVVAKFRRQVDLQMVVRLDGDKWEFVGSRATARRPDWWLFPGLPGDGA